MTTTKTTLANIRAHNERAGNYFFSRGATRFFNSRYYPYIYQGDGGIYFVNSSKFHPSEGRPITTYNVARYTPEDGDVDNIQKFKFLDDARDHAKQLAKGDTDK